MKVKSNGRILKLTEIIICQIPLHHLVFMLCFNRLHILIVSRETLAKLLFKECVI